LIKLIYERGSKFAQSSLDNVPPDFTVDCAGRDGVRTPITGNSGGCCGEWNVDAKLSGFVGIWDKDGNGGAEVRLML